MIAPACDLSDVLGKALSAFLAVLDGHTVASLLTRRTELGRLLGFESGVSHEDAPAAPP